MSTTYSLPGISRVGYVRADALTPQMGLSQLAGIPVAVFDEINWIPIHGIPECSRTTTMVNAGMQQQTLLDFYASDIPGIQSVPGLRVAFIVLDANARYWIIGTKEPPFPVIEEVQTTGKPGNESAVKKYTIRHTALRSLQKIRII